MAGRFRHWMAKIAALAPTTTSHRAAVAPSPQRILPHQSRHTYPSPDSRQRWRQGFHHRHTQQPRRPNQDRKQPRCESRRPLPTVVLVVGPDGCEGAEGAARKEFFAEIPIGYAANISGIPIGLVYPIGACRTDRQIKKRSVDNARCPTSRGVLANDRPRRLALGEDAGRVMAGDVR